MMKDVKRYTNSTDKYGDAVLSVMKPLNTGSWVAFSDHESIISIMEQNHAAGIVERDALRKRIATLEVELGQAADEQLAGLEERDELRALTDKLGELVYVPGYWRCPKCSLKMLAKVSSSEVMPNTFPQKCANGCGPMWRVTEQE